MPTDTQRIEEKLDVLQRELSDFRIAMEGRVTKIELKASLLGIIAGAVGGWFSRLPT